MLDLTPATTMMTALLAAVRDGQLGAATPCRDMALADLIDHVDGLSLAFTAAAHKEPLDATPSVDGSRLGAGWRPRVAGRLAELATAWQAPDAWTGMTAAGGVDLPGEVAGVVAVDELVVHGWDVARATGQPFHCDPALLEAAYGFVSAAVAQNPQGTPGLFGPPVRVAGDAALVDRLIGLTGRDPAWQPAAADG